MVRLINVEKIKKYRKEQGIAKKKFCEMCRISLNTYQRILNTGFKTSVNSVLKIAKVMGAELKDMFYNVNLTKEERDELIGYRRRKNRS